MPADGKAIIFLYFLLLLLCIPCALSIGISPADAYLEFIPNYEYVIDYSITSYRPFTFYVEGPFSEFTRVEEISHSETQGIFRIHIALPEDYGTPGKQRMYVAAKETPAGGGIGAVAIIRGFVEVDVPFPGFYAEMDLNVNDVNMGEPIPISVAVRNKGKLNISNARIEIKVSSEDAIEKTFKSENFALETNGAYTFQEEIGGNELKPGEYTVEATLYYEGNTKQKTAKFKVGAFDVTVVSYTEKMFNNSVNPFDIEVESRWNNLINIVYLDLAIKNGSKVLSTATTPPFSLKPWERKKSSFYWNTAGIGVGTYDLEIIIHYDKETKVENRKVYIVENEPVKEGPMMPMSTILLLLIAAILIAFNIYFIIGKRKKEREEKHE